ELAGGLAGAFQYGASRPCQGGSCALSGPSRVRSGLLAAAPEAAGAVLGGTAGALLGGDVESALLGARLGETAAARAALVGRWARSNLVCFPGDMEARLRGGWKRWDAAAVGDEVATCAEDDSHGPLVYRRIEELFVSAAPLWEVALEGGAVL